MESRADDPAGGAGGTSSALPPRIRRQRSSALNCSALFSRVWKKPVIRRSAATTPAQPSKSGEDSDQDANQHRETAAAYVNRRQFCTRARVPLDNCLERSSAMGAILPAVWPSRGPRHADREVARRPAFLTCHSHVGRRGARHAFHRQFNGNEPPPDDEDRSLLFGPPKEGTEPGRDRQKPRRARASASPPPSRTSSARGRDGRGAVGSFGPHQCRSRRPEDFRPVQRRILALLEIWTRRSRAQRPARPISPRRRGPSPGRRSRSARRPSGSTTSRRRFRRSWRRPASRSKD